MMWNISFYTSPLILTFLYRRGYFVAESISSFAKLSTGIGLLVVISLCMRGISRSQTKIYSKFIKSLEAAKANAKNEDLKNQLRAFDFEFKDWPVDFSAEESDALVRLESGIRKSLTLIFILARRKRLKWLQRFVANHTGYHRYHAKLLPILLYIHSVYV